MAELRQRDRIRRRAGEGLYQITWDSNGNPVTSNQKQQQQPQQYYTQDGTAITVLQAPQPQGSAPSSSATVVMDPAMELSLSATTTVWSYTLFLGSCLLFWMLYLLLPRGFRKQYCSAQRKRYAKRSDNDMPAAGYWLPVNKSLDDDSLSTRRDDFSPASTATSLPLTPPRNGTAGMRRQRSNPPSPEHPALRQIPPNRIIAETMGRLQGRGIRLVAHGVHCDPKRVWIKLEDDTASVTWQTEFPRRVPNQSGQVSIVLMRGSLHRIALCNILYIDVGKKTNALQQLDQKKVPDATCFSLLTQNGSLDLQANSKLERDDLVSCFSMILDDVHDEDWRALYEASPPASSVPTDTNTDPRSQGTEVAFGQSDLMVEL